MNKKEVKKTLWVLMLVFIAIFISKFVLSDITLIIPCTEDSSGHSICTNLILRTPCAEDNYGHAICYNIHNLKQESDNCVFDNYGHLLCSNITLRQPCTDEEAFDNYGHSICYNLNLMKNCGKDNYGHQICFDIEKVVPCGEDHFGHGLCTGSGFGPIHGAEKSPPIIDNLPNQTTKMNTPLPSNFTNLWDYTYDAQDPDNKLSFSVNSQTNSNLINCYIFGNRYINCSAPKINSWGYNDVTIKVTDTDGMTDTDTFRITVIKRYHPEISIPDQSTPEDTKPVANFLDLFNYANDVEDSDEILTFSIQTQTNQTLINCYVTNDRYVNCNTPLSNFYGYSDITVKVTDSDGLFATDAFRMTITPINDQPQIENVPDISTPEDTKPQNNVIDLWNYTFDYEDTDSQITYRIQSQSNLTLINCYITSNRYINCDQPVANKYGYSDITLNITDSGGLSDIDVFRATVTSVNDAPVIENVPDKQTDEDVTPQANFIDIYNYSYDIEDPDNVLTYSIKSQTNSLLISCSITNSHYISCDAPLANFYGYNDIIVEVRDTGGMTNSDTFRMIVNSVNDLPNLSGLPNQTINENRQEPLNNIIDLWTYANDIEDADEFLIFNITSQTNTSLITCNIDTNRYIDCNPPAKNKNGYSNIAVRVTDRNGGTATNSFRITVLPNKNAPQLVGLPDKSTYEDTLPEQNFIDLWNYSSDDLDTDEQLIFKIDGPSGLSLINCSIVSNRYVNCGMPAANMSGYGDIRITVIDTGNLSANDTFRMTVIPLNDPPIIDGIPDQTIKEDSEGFSFRIDSYISDIDNELKKLTVGVVSQTNSVLITCWTWRVYFRSRFYGFWVLCSAPTANSWGYSDITIKVTDPGGLSNIDTFRVIVEEDNNPPYFMENVTHNSDLINPVALGDDVIFNANIQDLDNDYVKLVVCYKQGLENISCKGIEYCHDGFETVGPKTCSYNTASAQTINEFTSYACDERGACVNGVNESFYVRGYPKDPKINIGNGAFNWERSGILNTTIQISEFPNELLSVVQSCNCKDCQITVDNRCLVPVNISAIDGIINARGVHVVYGIKIK